VLLYGMVSCCLFMDVVEIINIALRIIILSVGNSPSMSQSPTLDRIDKVKHYIRIKAHNNIALRFWCKSGV